MSLKRSIVYTFGAQFPKLILGVVSGIFITRLLGPEAKGAYAIFLANIQLFVLILGFGLSSSLVYFTAKKIIPEKNLLGISLVISALALGVLAVLLFGNFFDSLLEILLPDGYHTLAFKALMLATFGVEMLASCLVGLLAGRKQFEITSKIAVGQAVVFFITVFLYFWLFDYSGAQALQDILLISLSLYSLTLAAYIMVYRRIGRLKPDFRLRKDDLRALLTYSGIMYLANVLNFFNYRLDLWIVDEYASTESLGHYSLAVNLAQVLWMISVPIGSVMMTYLSSNEDMEYRARILKIFARLTSSVVLILAAIGFFVSEWLIPLVYGVAFSEAVLPFKILLPGLALSTIYKVFVPINIAHGKLKYNLTAVVISLCFTLVLDLYLIPKYGIVGAALATTIAYSASFVVVISTVLFKLKYPMINYFFISLQDIRSLKKMI